MRQTKRFEAAEPQRFSIAVLSTLISPHVHHDGYSAPSG